MIEILFYTCCKVIFLLWLQMGYLFLRAVGLRPIPMRISDTVGRVECTVLSVPVETIKNFFFFNFLSFRDFLSYLLP